MYTPINLSGFETRKPKLNAILRYVDSHTHTMLYRTNDWMHSWRVLGHLEGIVPLLDKIDAGFNVELARRLAVVHDDVKIITDDVQLYVKEKMTATEKEHHYQREQEAIGKLAQQFPFSIDGYPYREMLQIVLDKKCLEAQVVSYCDKFDGFGEALHEVFAGNRCFLRPVEGTKKDWGYIGRLQEFKTKYPQLQRLLEQEHPMFHPPRIDFELIVAQRKPHTLDSVQLPTGYVPYDCWKKNIINNGGIDSLVEQKEFLK